MSENTPLVARETNHDIERPNNNEQQAQCCRRLLFALVVILSLWVSRTLLRYPQPKPAEIWLIRHGEKEAVAGNMTREEKTNAMYNLSARGWERAFSLKELVKTDQWPRFGAIFATRYATLVEMEASFPNISTHNGHSLVKREYQTVEQLAEYLGITVDTNYYKDDFQALALAAARASVQTGQPTLVSWDHCTLPSLIARGFQCKTPECKRCWSDYQFDYVLQLQASVENNKISSSLVQMTREGFEHNSRRNSNVNVRNATPCAPSYCDDRKVAKTLETCKCFEQGHWRTLQKM